jgi:hypothetical protein
VGVLVALYLLTAVGLYRSANGFPPVVPVPVTRVP